MDFEACCQRVSVRTQPTVLALDHGATGIYNVVDDNPALMREWVLYVAELLGETSGSSPSIRTGEMASGLRFPARHLRGVAPSSLHKRQVSSGQ
jgi:hypothetical protein